MKKECSSSIKVSLHSLLLLLSLTRKPAF